MEIKERADKAAYLKISGKCTCTQAVLKVFEDKLEIAPTKLSRLAAGFAVGMGCMEGTCGALIGSVMIAGMIIDSNNVLGYSRKLVDEFTKRCGATTCKVLKGAKTGHVLCECSDCVRNAVLILGEVIE